MTSPDCESGPVQGAHLGKYVIAALLAIGLCGAGGGWFYHRQMQRRVIALWGVDAAALILSAPEVEGWKLQAADSQPASDGGTVTDGDTVSWAGGKWRIVETTGAAHAPGMPHLRRRLVQDDSFDWSATPAAQDRIWQYALRFSDGGCQATLLFDADYQCAGLAETGAVASVAPIARGLETVLPGIFKNPPN
ncbi:MAG TPA: hypothetical protein VFW87_06660 [Pirellulales bacterium]|nr:hypothetical protein [Pirellulales bacterium]